MHSLDNLIPRPLLDKNLGVAWGRGYSLEVTLQSRAGLGGSLHITD